MAHPRYHTVQVPSALYDRLQVLSFVSNQTVRSMVQNGIERYLQDTEAVYAESLAQVRAAMQYAATEGVHHEPQ